nr:proline-rich protein 5-like isoform X2 [Parasteatoda tepidariorum]
MSRRVKQKSTTNGLRYFQSLANVAVPGTLEEVPEEIEKKAEQIFGNDDWKSVENAIGDIFKNDSWLEESGILFKLHQNIKNILRSRTGTFLNDCYKEWLIKELNKEVLNLKGLKGVELLQRLKEKWTTFYSNTVPMLEVVFYLLKPKGRMSVRSTTLVTFRDVVFFSDNVEVSIRTEKEYASSELQHMILVLYKWDPDEFLVLSVFNHNRWKHLINYSRTPLETNSTLEVEGDSRKTGNWFEDKTLSKSLLFTSIQKSTQQKCSGYQFLAIFL